MLCYLPSMQMKTLLLGSALAATFTWFSVSRYLDSRPLPAKSPALPPTVLSLQTPAPKPQAKRSLVKRSKIHHGAAAKTKLASRKKSSEKPRRKPYVVAQSTLR